mgnify:CR=1 FL=1
MKKYSWQWWLKKTVTDKKESLDNAERQYNILSQIKMFTLFKQAFPEGDWTLCNRYEFKLPMRFSLEKEFAIFMATQYPDWVPGEMVHYVGLTAMDYIVYRHKELDISIEIDFNSTRPGATCVLNKIGEETKIFPIYEVVCSEQAAKEFAFEEVSVK